MKVHRYADMFPLMVGEEYTKLRDDIAIYGQIDPIITYQDEIVDGRNRYNACIELTIEPIFADYKGSEEQLLAYVISKNIIRRHLTSDQLACAAVDILPKLREEAKERHGERTDLHENFRGSLAYGQVEEIASRIFHTNENYVRLADKLKKKSPELLTKLKSGEAKLYKTIKEETSEDNTPKINPNLLTKSDAYQKSGLEIVNSGIKSKDIDFLL